jgi:hypothetical protein
MARKRQSTVRMKNERAAMSSPAAVLREPTWSILRSPRLIWPADIRPRSLSSIVDIMKRRPWCSVALRTDVLCQNSEDVGNGRRACPTSRGLAAKDSPLLSKCLYQGMTGHCSGRRIPPVSSDGQAENLQHVAREWVPVEAASKLWGLMQCATHL